VGAEQEIALRPRYQGHLMGGVGHARAARMRLHRAPRSVSPPEAGCSILQMGRHMRMSTADAKRPPSYRGERQ
jgi:hypothetical protein